MKLHFQFYDGCSLYLECCYARFYEPENLAFGTYVEYRLSAVPGQLHRLSLDDVEWYTVDDTLSDDK